MDPIVHSGQLLASRYQLTEPYEEQLPKPGTQLWAATDKLLGLEVRVLVLHPELPSKQAVLDAARRTALVEDPSIVRILSVDDSEDAPFVASEVPAGQRLSTFIDGTPLRADQVAALTGSIAQSLAATRQRSLRHLHISPDLVWVTPSGDIRVDGVGIVAALDAQALDLTPVEADRQEVRQLLALTASLLTGQPHESTNSDDDLPSTFEAALTRDDLPEGLRLAFERERDGYGVSGVSDLEHELTPRVAVNPAEFHNLGADSSEATELTEPTEHSSGEGVESPSSATAGSGEASFDDVLHGTVPSPTSSSDPIRVGPNADPTVRAVFPKITAPLGGTPLEESADTPTEIIKADETAAAEPTASSPAEPITPSTAPTPSTSSPDEPVFESTEQLSGTAVIKAVVDPNSPDVPSQTLKPEVSAGFAAGLAAASTDDAFFTPQWAPSGDDDVTEDTVSDDQETAEKDVVVESATPEIAEDPDATSDAAPVVATDDSGAEDDPEKPAAAEDGDPDSTQQLAAVTRTSVFAAAAEQIGSPATAPSVTPARPHGEPSVHTFEELRSAAPAATPEEDNKPEKQYNPSKVITLGAVILVAVGLIWSVGNLFRPTTEPHLRTPLITATPTPAPEGTAQPPAKPAEPAVISDVTLLNPQADTPDEDTPAGLPYAWDGSTGTGWSSWYYGDSNFAGKDGVGLEIKLAAEADVSEVVLSFAANGGNVQWRKTDAGAPSGGDLIAESSMSSEVVLKAAEPLRTDTVIVWFNSLPVNGAGQNRIELLEIEVR